MRLLLLPFIIFPIIEMIVLIEVGSAIGALPTVGLVLLTAIIGAALLRQQGLATLLRANQRMQSGQIPAREVCEGFILAVGGALLLTPGFVTDAIGLFCLLPGSRHWLAGRMLRRASVSGQSFFFGGGLGQGPYVRPGRRDAEGNVIIEGQFDRETDARNERDGDVVDHLDDRSDRDKKN